MALSSLACEAYPALATSESFCVPVTVLFSFWASLALRPPLLEIEEGKMIIANSVKKIQNKYKRENRVRYKCDSTLDQVGVVLGSGICFAILIAFNHPGSPRTTDMTGEGRVDEISLGQYGMTRTRQRQQIG